jgi:hypothetical protein
MYWDNSEERMERSRERRNWTMNAGETPTVFWDNSGESNERRNWTMNAGERM